MKSRAKKMSSQVTLVNLLSMFKSGGMTVSVNGTPSVVLDIDSKSLNLEAKGVKKSGLKLLNVTQEKGRGVLGLLKTSQSTAKKLSEMGWKVTLYDGRNVVLSMGSGTSRFTGNIYVNPLKLRRILDSV